MKPSKYVLLTFSEDFVFNPEIDFSRSLKTLNAKVIGYKKAYTLDEYIILKILRRVKDKYARIKE